MKTFICDRCRKVQDPNPLIEEGSMEIRFGYTSAWNMFWGNKREFDLCIDCIKDLEKFFSPPKTED